MFSLTDMNWRGRRTTSGPDTGPRWPASSWDTCQRQGRCFRLDRSAPRATAGATVTAMTGREERVARNEATSREINERIEEAHEEAPPDRHVRMVCECGQDSCDRLIAITLAEYERVRI